MVSGNSSCELDHQRISLEFDFLVWQLEPPRKKVGDERITIFEGGHQAEQNAAWNWLGRQKKGSPADFNLPKSHAGTAKGSEEVHNVDK
jgi:hypothetical protein